MIKAYIVARWSVYLFIIAPFVSLIVMIKLKDIFGVSENYWYYVLAIIYLLIIKFLLNEKYSDVDIKNLNSSKRFENGIGLIFFGHFMLALLFIIVSWQPVLAFGSLPVALLIIFSYTKGLLMTSEEIEKYKQNINKEKNNNLS